MRGTGPVGQAYAGLPLGPAVPDRLGALALALFVAAVAVAAATVTLIVLNPPHANGTGPSGTVHVANFPTSYSGNFALTTRPPETPYGSELEVGADAVIASQYEFEVGNYTAADAGMTVRVPGVAVTFPVAGGNVTISNKTALYTVNGPSWQGPFSLPTTPLNHSAIFLNGAGDHVAFSSQTLAVMTSRPWNTTVLAFRWNWTLFTGTPNDPVVSSGPLDSASNQTVVPDELVAKEASNLLNLHAGQSYSFCFNGNDIVGRTFSLHATVAKGTYDFFQVNETVPASASLPVCMTLPAVGNLSEVGQSVGLRFWDYQSPDQPGFTPLLLFSYNVNVTAPLAGNGASQVFGLPFATFAGYVSAAAVAGILLLAALVVARRRRRGGAPTAADRPTP